MLSYSTVKTPHLSTIAPFWFFLKEWILAWYMHSPPPALRFFTLSGVCMNAPKYQLLLHPHCRRLGLALHPFSGCTCQKTCSLCWGHALTLHNTPHPSRPAINSLQYFIHKHICCSVFHHVQGTIKACCPLSVGIERIHLIQNNSFAFPKAVEQNTTENFCLISIAILIEI